MFKNVWWLTCFSFFFIVVARKEDYNRIGYFWQITDIHFDPPFTIHSEHKRECWKHRNNGGTTSTRNGANGIEANKHFGQYNCDSTWELIDSAAKFMATCRSDNVEFVLWTGDALSHFAINHYSENHKLELMQILTDLLGKTFPVQFIFPALGHDDLKEHLSRMWSRWLPTDSIKTFQTGGYYIIERKLRQLQIVVLNTNLMKRDEKDEDAHKQWRWLERVLYKFQKNKETVYLVGHVAPGHDERQMGFLQPAHKAYTNYHNLKYLEIVRNYSSIIVGQFFGHWHSDSFRLMFDKDQGKPISWAMIAPSIAPKDHFGPRNPALRLYKFNSDTGQVYDYTQYYLDLSQANSRGVAEWKVEYNFTSYYAINEINPETLNHLTRKFINSQRNTTTLFDRYHRANSAKMPTHPRDICDINCAYNHYCAITQIDLNEFDECLKRTALTSEARNCYQCSISLLILLVMSLLFRVVSDIMRLGT